jgi:hypothetical protein
MKDIGDEIFKTILETSKFIDNNILMSLCEKILNLIMRENQDEQKQLKKS